MSVWLTALTKLIAVFYFGDKKFKLVYLIIKTGGAPYYWQNTTPPPNINIRNAIRYKVLTKIKLFKPPAKKGE